ncbi:hypothetical protein Bbelb_289070 [Branchiostoma belcheri]|nr:hypothetical protein Bbelb_289070 [Branchiostoma belcheri]
MILSTRDAKPFDTGQKQFSGPARVAHSFVLPSYREVRGDTNLGQRGGTPYDQLLPHKIGGDLFTLATAGKLPSLLNHRRFLAKTESLSNPVESRYTKRMRNAGTLDVARIY